MLDFVAGYAEMLVAILALLISLNANIRSRKSSEKADRLLISGKRTELLQELDRQHNLLRRLRFVVDAELGHFDVCPQLRSAQPEEQKRLKDNLSGLDDLIGFCMQKRKNVEAIDTQYDPAKIDLELVDVRRVSAHLETDIEHEKELLGAKENLVETVPEDGAKYRDRS